MTTASTTFTRIGRARMLALAGTIAFGAMIPVAPSTLASYDDTPSPTAAVTAPDQYDIPADGGLVGLTAIVHTGTGGADLLEDPAHDATPLLRLDDGTVVNLRVDVMDTVYDPDGATRWWPVEVNGQEGWISGFFLVDPEVFTAQQAVTTPDKAGTVTVSNRVPYDYTGSMVAEVSADGDGLVMRAEPNAASAEVTSLQDGVIVDLRIDELDTVYDAQGTRWWPVAFEGYEGWVSGFYLVEPGTEPQLAEQPSTAPVTDPSQALVDTGTLVVGDWAVIGTPGGNGVNLLTAPNAEADQSGFAPNQGLVEILADAGNGWFQIRWDDQVGYIDGALLTETQGPRRAGDRSVTPQETAAATSPAADAPTTGAAWVEGDEVEVQPDSGVGINMRAQPSIDAERVGYLNDGLIVEVTAGPVQDDEGNDWYSVTDGDQSGWVRADLIGAVGQPQAAAAAVAVEADEEGAVTAATNTASRNASTGFILPLSNYRFTQDFGCSSLGFYSYDPAWGCSIHDGVDLAATSGTPLVAVQGGTVVAAGWCDCGLGYYVELDHGDGLHTVYGHMASQPYVNVGQQVAQGETLGPVGSTGLSTGPHVHFMVRQDGVTQDPKNYLPAIN